MADRNLRSSLPPVPAGIDKRLAEYFTSVVRYEMQSIKDSVVENNGLLKNIEKDIRDLKLSLEDCSARVDTIVTSFLPSISSRIKDVATSLAERSLDIDVHDRKWHLIINGLEGTAGETEDVTRQKCVKLARDIGVQNAEFSRFSACHRLRHNVPNATTIIRFTDLAERENWLSKAKNLPAIDTSLSFSPDLPPVLRHCKNELLKLRRDLPSSEKRNTRIKYLAHFPYIELVYKDRVKQPVRPSKTKEQLLTDILGFSPDLTFSFNA